jgi:hypothetical protein
MWLMTRYGFFSTSVYTPGRVTVRARLRQHLELLLKRFPTLQAVAIVKTPHRDYAFRITIGQREWASVVQQLAAEQTWHNFKDEAARFEKANSQSHDYVAALHQIWHVMLRLQDKFRVKKAGAFLGGGYE